MTLFFLSAYALRSLAGLEEVTMVMLILAAPEGRVHILRFVLELFVVTALNWVSCKLCRSSCLHRRWGPPRPGTFLGACGTVFAPHWQEHRGVHTAKRDELFPLSAHVHDVTLS